MDLNKNISERGIVKYILNYCGYDNLKLYKRLKEEYDDFDNEEMYDNEEISTDFALQYHNEINWHHLSLYKSYDFTYSFYIRNEKIINSNDYYFCVDCYRIKHRMEFDSYWNFQNPKEICCVACEIENEEEHIFNDTDNELSPIDRFYSSDFR